MIRKFLRATPALMLLTLAGCGRYGANRSADFRDIFQFGAGITAENPESGMLPPSLGIYVQASDFINLGAMHFSGKSAEWDGRGMFSGFENRTRLGLGPWQRVNIDQHYTTGSENYFKKFDTLWADRMASPPMRFWNKPAKELHHEFLLSSREGAPVMHRGWQYWENIGVEISLSEPFLSHLGVNLRVGFDPSEISDLLLGFFHLDFKHDDLTADEYKEMVGDVENPSLDFKPAAEYPPKQ